MRTKDLQRPLKAGDMILIQPIFSKEPEHWGEFHHVKKSGMLYYRNCDQLKSTSLNAVVQIIYK